MRRSFEHSFKITQQGTTLNQISHAWAEETIARIEGRNTAFVGTVRYVDGTKANNSENGLTPATAKKTLTGAGGAYTVSANGDIIQFVDGNYDLATESGGYCLINRDAIGVLIRGNAANRSAVNLTYNGAGAYALRLRLSGECRFEDLTITTTGNKYSIYFDNDFMGENAFFKCKNVAIFNTAYQNVHLNNANTETRSKWFEFDGCEFNNTEAGEFVNGLNAGLNTTIFLKSCTLKRPTNGAVYINVPDGSKMHFVFYNNTITMDSSHTAVIMGNDTAAPTTGVTGIMDIRGNVITYPGSLFGHCILYGRGTDKIISYNNTINMPSVANAAAIGFVIKSTTTNLGDSVFEGNYINAPRPLLIKGGSKLTAKKNTLICNNTVVGFGLEFDNTSNNCRSNVVKNNNIVGKTAMIRMAIGDTAETTYASCLTSDINDNKYFADADVYVIDAIQGNKTWAEKTEFWGANTNDNASTKLVASQLPILCPA